jgi:DNA-binding transcriptional LysR family regulator
MKTRNFDLNLLVVLQTVLAEGSVTRAAERLNLTQPAVSQALQRAREVFGDPLLMREGGQMIATQRARDIVLRMPEVFAAVESLLAPCDFDPASAKTTFVVAANDYSELLVLPPLISTISAQSPGSRMIVRSVEGLVIDHTIDFALYGLPPPEGPFHARALYDEHFVMIARPDHPAMTGPLTAETFAALPQALVSPSGQGVVGLVDATLRAFGLTRHIALSITRFTTLPQILATTDLIASVPSRFAERPEVKAMCAIRALPFESPQFTMRMVWHQARDNDPAGRWLRSQL